MEAGTPRKPEPPLRRVLEWCAGILLAAVLALAFHAWVGQLLTVDGQGMEPALEAGDVLAIGKPAYWFSTPQRGDIVVVRYPGSRRNVIVRVIALGGESVAVRGGVVYISGMKLDEPYLAAPTFQDMPETAVPADTVFVMGDNRADSADSRLSAVGPIPVSRVVGRAYAVTWPLGRIGTLTGYYGKIEN